MVARDWRALFIMKKVISIKQGAVVRNNRQLDIIDLAILDFIKDVANSEECTKVHTPQGIYFEVSHRAIMNEMPILNITTKQGILKHINKLIDAQLIERHPNTNYYQMPLYKFGRQYQNLEL